MRKIVKDTIDLLINDLDQNTVDNLFLLRLFDSPAEIKYLFSQIHFTKERLEEEIGDADKILAESKEDTDEEEIMELLRDRMQIALDELSVKDNQDKENVDGQSREK